ncbi:MAG: hypothetical protein ACE5IR_27080 [bacterium]
MAYTFIELKGKTAAQLKEIAAGIEHEAVHGYTQMHKEHLLTAICTALGIVMHVHHDIKGVDKASIKSKIRVLKKERAKAIEAKDSPKLKDIRRRIKTLKKTLRKAMV